jgi:hypothetical protein
MNFKEDDWYYCVTVKLAPPPEMKTTYWVQPATDYHLFSQRNNSASTQSSRGGTTQEDHQSKVSVFKALYRPCQPNENVFFLNLPTRAKEKSNIQREIEKTM